MPDITGTFAASAVPEERLIKVSGTSTGDRFGFGKGHVVQEFGYDDDVDFDLRDDVEDATGEPLEDEDYRGVSDGVLAWWRASDGDVDDLADYLVDCGAGLDEEGTGIIWLLVPGQKSDEHVPTTEVSEAAKVAGLSATTSAASDGGWTGFRLTKHGRKK